MADRIYESSLAVLEVDVTESLRGNPSLELFAHLLCRGFCLGSGALAFYSCYQSALLAAALPWS